MSKKLSLVLPLLLLAFCWRGCKDDVASAGKAVLDEDDEVVVLVDTFPLHSSIDSCKAIISQADSFLLGEIETKYGLLRASILTQLACPEGYSYPENAVVDSICLFMYYGSWAGDANAPMAIDAYMMDKQTFSYTGTYPTDLDVSDYCTKNKTILANRRIVAASEKLDSVQREDGTYIPMLRMRVNDDFMNTFWAIQSFGTQEEFSEQFKGLLIESSFGSSTMLNISDIALGVFYHFNYLKRDGDPTSDTTVYDMKAFYANSEVRTVNHLEYPNKKELVETLQNDSDTYNYIIAPAGVYTRMTFPMAQIIETIIEHMKDPVLSDTIRRPYVNQAEVRIDVTNRYTGSEADKTREEWLQPASYMLLVKEESMERFFANRELPNDTCALLSPLVQGTDENGNATYYYRYDLSDFLTYQLHDEQALSLRTYPKEMKMLLVPVSVSTSTTSSAESVYSAVRQQQTLSATQIRSAQNGMKLKVVYSGFTIPSFTD